MSARIKHERNRISYDDVRVVVQRLGLQGEWIKTYHPKSILFKFKTHDGGAVNLRCYKRKERVYCQGRHGLKAHLDSLVRQGLRNWNRGIELFPVSPAPEGVNPQLSEINPT